MTTVDKFDIATQINELTDRMRVDRVDFDFFRGPTGIFLLGALFGGAIVYYLDPISGRRRRSLLRDQRVRLSHVMNRDRDRSFDH